MRWTSRPHSQSCSQPQSSWPRPLSPRPRSSGPAEPCCSRPRVGSESPRSPPGSPSRSLRRLRSRFPRPVSWRASSCPWARLPCVEVSRAAARSTRRSNGPREELATVARDVVATRSADLERTLARARADSLSAYAEEERRLAETRRTALGESEQRLRHGLAEAFTKVQGQVEQRLASWHQDLDRAQGQLGTRLEQVAQRERSLIEALEARFETDVDRLKTVDEEQKAAVARLREDLARTTADVAATAEAELESHAADRRRALHQVAERMTSRERDLLRADRARGGGRDAADPVDVPRRRAPPGGAAGASPRSCSRALRRCGGHPVRRDDQGCAGGRGAKVAAGARTGGAGVRAAGRIAARRESRPARRRRRRYGSRRG